MEDELKKTDTVLSLIHDRPFCYEVVVGPGKSRKYADVCRKMRIPSSNGSGGKSINSEKIVINLKLNIINKNKIL